MNQKGKRILAILVSILVFIVGMSTWYVLDYYHVSDATEAMQEDENVQIKQTKTGLFYDGPGTQEAIIFYPGAKVEGIAYASLLKKLAKEGIDCFLVDMPCHLAILGVSKADDIMQEYVYKSYYMMGHSLGGAMAAVYTSNHTKEVDGLILLAAFSTKDLSNSDVTVLSIYGNQDGVLNLDKVKELRSNLPQKAKEVVIEGGNHANFGNYGQQKKDNPSTITRQEQQDITANAILSLFEE